MKTPVAPNWIAGLVLAMAWLPGGLAQNETNRPPASLSDATPVVTPARQASEHQVLTSPLDVSTPSVIALSNDAAPKSRQPPKIRLSPWATEIVKLAEARIGDEVMYSFIDNSGTFNLGADQIVYLSDVGVPSQIISAMLQHDQDLISGVRPLTVASEPAHESILPALVAADGGDSKKTSTQPALAATTVVPPAPRPAATAEINASPEINRSLPEVQLAALPSATTEKLTLVRPAAPSTRPQSAVKKKSFYPVPATQPVELTSPIIFIEGESRPPNTIIIVGFPRTEPITP